MDTPFATPDWAAHAVWYHVLVSRFRNGDPANDPAPRVPWTWNWPRPFGEEVGPRGYYRHIWFRRYGGDLAGLREKLPYLRDLGVNALYLMPVFAAESEHKYDTFDYRHIDDSYGVKGSLARISGETDDPATWQWTASDRLFLAFVAEAHRQGFRVILDVSFNHVGRRHGAFQDVLRHGRDSRYAAWFEITQWTPSLRWKAWDGENGSLPEFRREGGAYAASLREHLFAITRRWMDPDGNGDASNGIDGWRLDVANLVPATFWREWRRLVKSINPEACIIGEIWGPAQAWLRGDQFDGVMNYGFARRMQRFFVNRRKASAPSDFVRSMTDLLTRYPPQATRVMQNLLDSHDTDRFASMMVNPDLPFDRRNRVQDSNPRYNLRPPTEDEYRRVRCAWIVQFTLPGAPMVWYGDEVGMFGADDPHCRKPMIWKDLEPYDDPAEHVRDAMFEHCRRLMAIRHACIALRIGDIRFVHADDSAHTLAYTRTHDDEQILIVINNDDAAHDVSIATDLPDRTEVFDLLSPAAEVVPPAGDDPQGRPSIRIVADATPSARVLGGRLAVSLPPRWGAVLVPRVRAAPGGMSAETSQTPESREPVSRS